MPRSGNGTYTAPASSVNDAVAGTTIESTAFNALVTDLEAAMTGSIAKDGQTVVTGNLDFGGTKTVTNLANAATDTQPITKGQIAASGGSALVGYAEAGTGAETSNAQSALRAISINAAAYHAGTDPDDTLSFQRAATYANSLGVPVRFWIPPGVQWEISGTINLDLAEHSVIDARGARIICAHDGVAFDLNPGATAAAPAATAAANTKRNITWLGGSLSNTNVAKTASVGIQAYMMRIVRFVDVHIGARLDLLTGGFYAGIKFAGLDSYRFIDCYMSGHVRHFWVPPAGTVYSAATTAHDLIDVEFRGTHMECIPGTGEAGIYFENVVNNFHMNGGSANGVFSVAHVRLADSAAIASEGISFHGAHFEQMGSNLPAVLFVDSGKGFNGVSFDGQCVFGANADNWQGMKLQRCLNVTLGALTMRDGSTGRAEYGVYVDNNCRSVRVTTGARFHNYMSQVAVTGTADNGSGLIRLTVVGHGCQNNDRVFVFSVTGTTEANAMWLVTVVDADHVDLQGSTFASAWISGGFMRIMNAIVVQSTAVREHITIEPEYAAMIAPRTLTDYNASAQSDQTTVINMSHQFIEFVNTGNYLWPKAYHMNMQVNDSGSAAAAGGDAAAVLRKPGSAAGTLGVRASSRGLPNDNHAYNSGVVQANNDGNVEVQVLATGASTLDLMLSVTALVQ